MTNDNHGAEKNRGAWRTRAGLIVGACLLVAVVAVVGFRRWNAPKAEENQFHKVKRGDLLISVVEGGALKADRKSVV